MGLRAVRQPAIFSVPAAPPRRDGRVLPPQVRRQRRSGRMGVPERAIHAAPATAGKAGSETVRLAPRPGAAARIEPGLSGLRRRRSGAKASMRDQFDVIVIGSGAGGAPIAHTLAKAGKSVLVLEKGPLIRPQYQAPNGRSDFKRDELISDGPEKKLQLAVANKGVSYYTSHVEP